MALCIFVSMLVFSSIAVECALEKEDLQAALHFVPPTSQSIRRFPEPHSKYSNFLNSFRHVSFSPNTSEILVSALDYIFRLDIESFTIKETNITTNYLLIPPNPEDYPRCIRSRRPKYECNNTMMFSVYNGSEIFACGTYTIDGRCWAVSPETFKTTRVIPEHESSPRQNNRFVARSPLGNMVAVVAKNGGMFSFYNLPNRRGMRAVFPNNVYASAGSDYFQFADPTFVSAYEADDGFIYIFFFEKALEVSERRMVYSRVGRICSYDRGEFSGYQFVTFSKSQIVCYKSGRVPDYYDFIQSATAHSIRDSDGNSEVFIYASFTATRLATGSSALCKYRLKDIQQSFKTDKYYLRKGSGLGVHYVPGAHPWPDMDVSQWKCDSKLKTKKLGGSPVLWITMNPLVINDVEPYEKNIILTFPRERVASLYMEDVNSYDVNGTNVSSTILFAGTDSGKILKVVLKGTDIKEPYIAEEINALEKPGAIANLLPYKNYLIGYGRAVPLVRVEKERCESKYIMCSGCLKARDPFCAWSLSMKKCTRATELLPSDRLQELATGSHGKCPPVDVAISCSLTIVDNIPGAWTAIQCTGHGNIAPKVLAWKKDEARLDIHQDVYQIRVQNSSSQLLIIKGYTSKDFGKYGCIVGLDSNKSECSIEVKGQEPDVNCSKKSTDCTCEVSGFPLPIVSKIVNGRETLRIGQAGLTSIQQGEALFAFNAFGDDAFVCPVTMVPAKITTTATVFTTKSTTNATATTNSSTSHSATQTKTKSAKLTSKSTSSGTTARPTTLPITTGRTTKSFQTSPTGRRTTKQLPIVTSKPNGSTTVPRGPSNAPRVKCSNDGKWFAPFLVCLLLLISAIIAIVGFIYFYVLRRKKYDKEDSYDGKSGTLRISPSKQGNRNNHKKNDLTVLFKKKKSKTESGSQRPLSKGESKNGSTPCTDIDSGKTAQEMDDIASNEDKACLYLMHVKT